MQRESMPTYPTLPADGLYSARGRLFSSQRGATCLTWASFALRFFLMVAATPARAQWSDSFETPETSWWHYSKPAKQKLLRTQRVFQNARDGEGFEKLEVSQRGQAAIHLAHRIDPMLVIDELHIQLWVKSSRVGTQLGARISLPRSADARTGERTSVIVLGDKVTEANRWMLLQVKDMASLLDSELPMVRKSVARKIDPAEAYVDLIVIEEAGGAGDIQVCVDGLSIDGIVFAKENQTKTHQARFDEHKEEMGPAPLNTKMAATLAVPHQVRAAAGIFEVDGRPEFIRSIEYSGESLEFLKSLGFNAVELRQPPTVQQDQEAMRLGLWLIAPPVFDPKAVQKQRVFPSVIAWTLGDGVGEAELEPARKYIAESRGRSSDATQAFVANPDSHLWEWSRLVDLLITDVHGVMGSGELSSSGQRLQSQRALGRPGAPTWGVVHTEPPAALVTQWKSYLPENGERVCVSPEQIRLQAFHGVLGGVRGLVFKSRNRLDGKNSADELRAASLKWVNLQLDLIAPWAATGDADIVSDRQNDTLIGSLTTDRATLLMLVNQSPYSQFETSGSFNNTTTTLLTGHFERTPRYQLTWRVTRQLSPSRSRDSSKVVVERTGSVDYLVLAEDPAALKFAVDLTEQKRSEFAAIQMQVASLWLGQSQSALQLPQNTLAGAESKLAQAAQELGKNDHYMAIRSSDEAMRLIASVRHGIWKQMVGALPSPLVSPLCVSSELSVAHQELSQRLSQAEWTSNRLPAGDLESIESLKNASWLAYQTRDPDLETDISLCEREPQSGRGAISLVATAKKTGEYADRASAAITSVGVPVRRGDLVRYRAWIRAGDQNSMPAARIQLFDNLAGREFAVVTAATPQWTPVVLYRFAPTDGDAALTMALLGTGHVDIDSVEVETISQEQVSNMNSARK